jgi:type I restriction enzyme R subunit
MTRAVTESVVEATALEWCSGLGYGIVYGPEIAPEEPLAERADWDHVVLVGRLQQALARINPAILAEALEEVIRKVTRPWSPSLLENSRSFHQLLVEGVDVIYRTTDGRIVHSKDVCQGCAEKHLGIVH